MITESTAHSRVEAISREKLEELVKKHKYLKGVMLGLGLASCFWNSLRDRLDREGLELDAGRNGKVTTRRVSRHLIAGSTINRTNLKKALLALGLLKNQCYICGLLPEWNGKTLTLILDHINGVYNDNRLENLQIVCPNCSLQLETYGSRNRPYKK